MLLALILVVFCKVGNSVFIRIHLVTSCKMNSLRLIYCWMHYFVMCYYYAFLSKQNRKHYFWVIEIVSGNTQQLHKSYVIVVLLYFTSKQIQIYVGYWHNFNWCELLIIHLNVVYFVLILNTNIVFSETCVKFSLKLWTRFIHCFVSFEKFWNWY